MLLPLIVNEVAVTADYDVRDKMAVQGHDSLWLINQSFRKTVRYSDIYSDCCSGMQLVSQLPDRLVGQ